MAENKKKFRGPEYRVINMISITGKDGEYHPMEDMTEEEIEHQRKISGKNISSRKITAEELDVQFLLQAENIFPPNLGQHVSLRLSDFQFHGCLFQPQLLSGGSQGLLSAP